jgi:putative ABC transport system permease protein
VAREDPRALLASREAGGKGGRGGLAPRLAAAGLLLAGLASALFLGPLAAWPWGGFALALALVLAPPLCAPLLLGAAARLPAPARLGARSGARDLGGRLRSTAVAAGALSVAVAMMAAVTVMVGSFRRTVEDWLSDTLRADVYVTTPSWRRARSEATLAPGLVERLAAGPGVVAVDRLRQRFVEAGGRRVSIAGFDATLPQRRLSLAAGDPAEALRRLRGEGAALVSEPLARKAGLAVGGTVTVAGPAGPIAFPVAGVYRDYGGDGGALLVDLPTLARTFGDGPPSNAALYLAPGIDPEAVVARVRAAFPDQALLVRSNRTLRAEVLAIFEQTFAVTRLLQGMSLVIAVAGITLTLLVLARERAAELALYRALGATRAQLFRVFVGRGLGIAAAGLLLGAGGGAALSLVLVEVVNPAWFGWTIGLSVPWGELGAEAATIGVAALLASLYPAARASAAPAQELSRDAL